MQPLHQPSPRTGAAAAPVSLPISGSTLSVDSGRRAPSAVQICGSLPGLAMPNNVPHDISSSQSAVVSRRHSYQARSPGKPGRSSRKIMSYENEALAKAQSRSARRLNDSMVYIDGPQVYACAQCRTHLTSHDEIISKSFHGRHGRAYLFDNCVNVNVGPAEDRRLITGLHSVSDIFCKRCDTMVGWTYAKAYEHTQKYKEGKFIIEKINLHLEESDYYDVEPPAGERRDRFRARSISWGSESCLSSQRHETIYEYHPSVGSPDTHGNTRKRNVSVESSGSGNDQIVR